LGNQTGSHAVFIASLTFSGNQEDIHKHEYI
jgi:hypothetical protein